MADDKVLTTFHILCFHRLVAEKREGKSGWLLVAAFEWEMWDPGSGFFFFFSPPLIAAGLDRGAVGRFCGEIFGCFEFFLLI